MKKFKKPDPRAQKGRPQAKGGQHTPRPSVIPPGRCVVGIHAVEELLKVRAKRIEHFWIRENYEEHPQLKELFEEAKGRGVKIKTQPQGLLDKIISSHQGVLAFTQDEPELDFRSLEKEERATLIALDEVEDPHNLGAVLRTAWLFGAKAVLTPEHRAAQLSPAVSKVAQGAVEHVPVVRDGSLPSQLEDLKKMGFWILGLSHEAKQDIFSLDIPQKVVWVLGSEAAGIRKSVAGVCDDLVSIPQSAPTASYNVSVAAAIALSETYRQRRPS